MILLFNSSCKDKEKSGKSRLPAPENVISEKRYLSLIISMDTLSLDESKKVIYTQDSLLSNSADHQTNPFYHYFRAQKYGLEKKQDSALAEYKRISDKQKHSEIVLLKTYNILSQDLGNLIVDASLMNKILSAVHVAESRESKITYQFYDLAARAYYQNENQKEALAYTERYYNKHPYKLHPVIQQRYYDISFLLASSIDDYSKMMMYNSKARQLARSIRDSLAIARTYDYESQIYARQGQYAKVLVCNKICFNYLKKTNNLNNVAYNNIAVSFIRNHQPDSAIHYFREAIAFVKKNPRNKQNQNYYKGLSEAYKMKGAYASALRVIDSAYDIEVNNIREIEAVKIAELKEKYEAEKKDRNIAELSNRNTLNEKVIRQQKWTLLLALVVLMVVISFFYSIHRQYRLKEKNKLLSSENKRLNMEQKLLQAQLNPHFIFNSIANLQSLVASGDTKESVRYLTVFSGLLRNILEQSRKDFISLEEEIVSLENYLHLQQMRYIALFDYQIDLGKDLDLAALLIPPMLVQPFVENAIEHGFRNIDYKGVLTIAFKTDNNQIFITVDDNGTGLAFKEPKGQKKQSLAGIILKERLEALFKSSGQEAKFEIVNKQGNGTHGVTVNIVIPKIKD
nr:histidine kinase [Pedobacter sp. ASV19]